MQAQSVVPDQSRESLDSETNSECSKEATVVLKDREASDLRELEQALHYDEFRKHRLCCNGCLIVLNSECGQEGIDQISWHYKISKLQAGKKHLGIIAHIYDPARGV